MNNLSKLFLMGVFTLAASFGVIPVANAQVYGTSIPASSAPNPAARVIVSNMLVTTGSVVSTMTQSIQNERKSLTDITQTFGSISDELGKQVTRPFYTRTPVERMQLAQVLSSLIPALSATVDTLRAADARHAEYRVINNQLSGVLQGINWLLPRI